MWILITITSTVVVLFLIGRNSIKSSISKNITLNGGMLVVYNVLVDGLLEDSDARILSVGDNSINLGMTNRDGSTTFRIVQLYDNVTITWNVSSQTFGNHTLRWEFPNGTDQNKIHTTITTHIEEYNHKLILKSRPEESIIKHDNPLNDARMHNLEIIAKSFNCTISKTKMIYFNKMDELNSSPKDLDQLFHHLSISIIKEANNSNTSPNDTQSGIFYEWTKEYSKNKNLSTTAFDLSIISDLYNSNQSLLIALIEAKKKGDKILFKKLLSEHPEHIDLFISSMTAEDKTKNTIDEEYPF